MIPRFAHVPYSGRTSSLSAVVGVTGPASAGPIVCELTEEDLTRAGAPEGGSQVKAVGALLVTATLAASAACSSSGGSEAEASCEYRVQYDERMYSDVSHADFEIGEALGAAVVPRCDVPSDDAAGKGEPTVAYAIVGVDPGVAIAVDDAPDDVFFVLKSMRDDLPPEVQKLIKG